jgi:acetyltransferase-like isoleucine patch superfamily enzyme
MAGNVLDRLFTEGKSRFMRWLARELEAAQSQSRYNSGAVLSPSTVLCPESGIENFYGERDRIRVGEHSHIRGRLLTYGHGGRIRIGDWCYLGVRSEIWSMDSITIGNRVLIAHDVNIHDGTGHSLRAGERHEHFRRIVEEGHPRSPEMLPGVKSSPIVIEDDVWISFGVTILKGVCIGAGSVIAAGSIVAESVPPRMFYRCETKPLISPLSVSEEGTNAG